MTTAAEARQKLAGKTIWLWHYLHPDWQWEASRAWHADRYAVAVQEALDIMQRNPEFCYYFDTESEFWEPVARQLGPRLEELKQRIGEGRVRIVSAQVANCRPTQTADETYLRNLQLGRAFFEANVPPTDYSQFHSVDIAIGGSQMPQVLALAGFKYYRAWRPHGPLNAHRIPHQFWWQSADGSRVLVTRGIYGGLWVPTPAFDNYRENWDAAVEVVFKEFFADQLLVERSPSDQLWMIQGMDDARPLRRFDDTLLDLEGFIAEWRKRESVPIHWCTPLEFSRAVAARGESLQVLSGPLDGCDCGYNAAFGGANGLWRWRQLNDRRLLRAEWWNAAAAAALGAPPIRPEMLKLWRQHLTYQAHAQEAAFSADLAELFDLARDVRFHAEKLERSALVSLAQAAGGGTRTTRYLFNPHPWPVQGEVEIFHACAVAGVHSITVQDAAGGAVLPSQPLREFRHGRFVGGLTDQTLLVQAGIPALGFRRIELIESAEPAATPPAAGVNERGELAVGGLRLTFRNHALREVRDANGKIYQMRDGSAWPGLWFHVLDHQDWLSAGPEVRRVNYQPASSAWLQNGPLRWQHRTQGILGPWRAQIDTVIGARERELTFHLRLEGHWDEAPETGFITLLADIAAGGQIMV
ncbi:MAG: glycoside hydrolase family 38 N-terminal domain-containing protein, partial [Anaerolineae bacterium]